MLLPFVKCDERRVEYLCCCLRRSIVSSSCWICVIISCPFNDTWQIGHCGFCESNVDDRHRFSREITKGVSIVQQAAQHILDKQKKKNRKKKKDRRSVCLFHSVFYSISLVFLIVKSLIILWLRFHLYMDHYHTICLNSLIIQIWLYSWIFSSKSTCRDVQQIHVGSTKL